MAKRRPSARTRQEFLEREWLDEIIIRTAVEARHAIQPAER
jgi:hypothetical protein